MLGALSAMLGALSAMLGALSVMLGARLQCCLDTRYVRIGPQQLLRQPVRCPAAIAVLHQMPFANKILQQSRDIGRVIAGKLLQSLVADGALQIRRHKSLNLTSTQSTQIVPGRRTQTPNGLLRQQADHRQHQSHTVRTLQFLNLWPSPFL